MGHVFKLGLKYTKALGFTVLDSNKQSVTPIMGCYGIGVSRTVQAIAEQNNDKDGIVWPASVAPYQVVVDLLDPSDATCAGIAEKIEAEFEAAGIDVMVDDRDERPGVKFKDADLIGFPVRIVVGAKALAKGGVEVRERTTGRVQILPPEGVRQAVQQILESTTPTSMGWEKP